MSGHGLVNRGLDRPAPLARVRNSAFEFLQNRILDQGGGCQVEQPRGNHAATPPYLCDVWQIEVVLVVFRVAQWCRLGVDLMFLLADVGGSQDAQAFGIGGHEAVLDAVVNHLNEVTGAVWATMQITLLGCTGSLLTARRARYFFTHAWGQSRKDWIEVLHDLLLTANHHA